MYMISSIPIAVLSPRINGSFMSAVYCAYRYTLRRGSREFRESKVSVAVRAVRFRARNDNVEHFAARVTVPTATLARQVGAAGVGPVGYFNLYMLCGPSFVSIYL
jgi:hypothetical protein